MDKLQKGTTMIALTIDDVDGFVTKLQHKGIDVKWDGWTMVFFKEHPNAERSAAGRQWGGRWGFETKVSPNEQGKWLVDYRLARRSARGK